ncbi:rod-binding protein [Pseudidiomarina woesei]|uniref:Rod binding protein n=1 Tax=Pseudidiomarina woesei TaxID=1381080 RepID=A0A0K6HC95_9GAMM|nr:rod-binding protein [Pseudidiomarina woesei]CUA88585.1 Rod binding protein [Pseudidiomarina woesei]
MANSVTSVGLALDAQQLNKLKTQSQQQPKEAAAEAARQFEALFISQMMKSMRQAGGESELFNSSAMRTYTDMFDQQMATEVAGKGIGLAEQLLQQLQLEQGKKP